MKLVHKRDRYQRGSLTTEKRNNGPDVWVYRWREPAQTGQAVQRKRIVGTKREYPTESAAWRAVDAMQLDINAETVSRSLLTVRELAEHYKGKELVPSAGKTAKTLETYLQHIDDYILPRWGGERLADIKAFRVEEWLGSLDKADGTKSKTKAVFSVLYQHAMRYGWAERNPIREVRQSAKPRHEPDVLAPDEVAALLKVLPGYARCMVVASNLTGLRRGELVGLKWEDVDFENSKLHIRRSMVDQVEGPPKTKESAKPTALEKPLADAFLEWKKQTSYSAPSDWVFASPFHAGKLPYWANAVLEKFIRPGALKVGITKRIGWHTFRRTLPTNLIANGESVKTTQGMMRHATPSMTLGTYAQAVPEDMRAAQNKLAAMYGLVEGAPSVSA